MTINALNSGADIWMADFEDSTAPTWENIVDRSAQPVRRAARECWTSPRTASTIGSASTRPTVMMRPRGWHLCEKHLTIDGRPLPASLVDFGLYFFHNAQTLIDSGAGPYFYLPEAGVPTGSPAVERRLRAGPGPAGDSAGHHPGDRADRDAAGGVRDGGDPLRTAGPLGRAERRALGLHVLLHQDVRESRCPSSCCPTARRSP